MSIDARLARAEQGDDPCPMCGSSDVQWRRRRPIDVVLTIVRWPAELFGSLLSGRTVPNRLSPWEERLRSEYRAEILEADTGFKTPRRFWKCRACNREGHVF